MSWIVSTDTKMIVVEYNLELYVIEGTEAVFFYFPLWLKFQQCFQKKFIIIQVFMTQKWSEFLLKGINMENQSRRY